MFAWLAGVALLLVLLLIWAALYQRGLLRDDADARSPQTARFEDCEAGAVRNDAETLGKAIPAETSSGN